MLFLKRHGGYSEEELYAMTLDKFKLIHQMVNYQVGQEMEAQANLTAWAVNKAFVGQN